MIIINTQYEAMQQDTWLVTGFTPQRPGFTPTAVHAGFVVDKMALGQVFSIVLSFATSITPLMLNIHSLIIWLMNNGLVRSLVSTQTQSHSIVTIIKNQSHLTQGNVKSK
jgi:hypothetical protein